MKHDAMYGGTTPMISAPGRQKQEDFANSRLWGGGEITHRMRKFLKTNKHASKIIVWWCITYTVEINNICGGK